MIDDDQTPENEPDGGPSENAHAALSAVLQKLTDNGHASDRAIEVHTALVAGDHPLDFAGHADEHVTDVVDDLPGDHASQDVPETGGIELALTNFPDEVLDGAAPQASHAFGHVFDLM